MPHLHDMINDLKRSRDRKYILTTKSKLISSTGSNEKHAMYSKSGNSTVLIISKLFSNYSFKCQIGLEQSMRSSTF